MTGFGLERLSLNQATVKYLGLADAVALCARHDIPAIGLWRDRVAETGLAGAVAAVRSAGLRVSSLCRGGFFTVGHAHGRAAVRADNVAAVREAAALEADALILVCGGLVPGSRDLGLARRMVADAIGELVPVAQRLGVRLGIEALHPMFCADRCVIATLGEAVDLALLFPAEAVGVVVDTYHVWWDARLFAEIARAAGRIVSYQVCDWVLPLPADVLLGRGHLGDGVIDFGPVSDAVTAAGYRGYVEVEIFNADVWAAPPDETAATVRERFAAALGGAVPRGLPGRSVTSQNLGAVGAAGGGGAVGVQGDGPAPLVDGHVVVEEAVQGTAVDAGLAAVGQVGHMVHFTRCGGLVAAAGPAAVLVPQDHRAADGGGDLGAAADVQGKGRPGQPRAELPGPQERGQAAGAGDQVDGLADDGVTEHLQGLRRGRPRAGQVGRRRAGSGCGGDPQCGPWPANCRHRPTRSSRAAGSIWPVTTGMMVASQATAPAEVPFSQAAPSLPVWEAAARWAAHRTTISPIHWSCRTDPSSRARSSARDTCPHTFTGCPARSGSRPAGDQAAHRVFKRIVITLLTGPGVLRPHRRGQRLQDGGDDGGALGGQVTD